MSFKDWVQAHSFGAGERIIFDEACGTVIDVYPDGIHHVKLDESGRVVACLGWQLRRAAVNGQKERISDADCTELHASAEWTSGLPGHDAPRRRDDRIIQRINLPPSA